MERKWKAFDLDRVYEKDEKLRRDDVRALMDWVDQQPHLPKVDEHTALIFFHSCGYSSEFTKQTLDKFFTLKSLYPEIFLYRNPALSPLKEHLEYGFQMILPTKTPDGQYVFFFKLMDPRPEAFDQIQRAKLAEMAGWASYMKNGPSEGLVLLVDFSGFTFGHVAKTSPMVVRKQLYFLQDCCAIRLNGIHVINTTPMIVAFMTFVKPFLNKSIQSMIHLHDTVEGLRDFVPKQCLPKDYGGELEDVKTLHEKMKQELLEFAPLFERQDQMVVDESRRPQGMKSVVDISGEANMFRAMELD